MAGSKSLEQKMIGMLRITTVSTWFRRHFHSSFHFHTTQTFQQLLCWRLLQFFSVDGRFLDDGKFDGIDGISMYHPERSGGLQMSHNSVAASSKQPGQRSEWNHERPISYISITLFFIIVNSLITRNKDSATESVNDPFSCNPEMMMTTTRTTMMPTLERHIL